LAENTEQTYTKEVPKVGKAECAKAILGRFLKKKTVRLADISGDTNWRKHHKFCADGSKPLPYDYSTAIDMRQRELFQVAKQLQQEGVLKIVYKSGENWFVNQVETNPVPDLTFLEMTVTVQPPKKSTEEQNWNFA
jgi:hypothetical protein